MILFFDTETTGLPANYNAPATDVKNWPRVIQLAYALFDEQENLIEKRVDLIKPDGWTMPTGDFWVKHGYSQEKSEMNGIAIIEALSHFNTVLQKCKTLVAHNMSFDEKIIGAEYIRVGMKSENKPAKLCTKVLSTDYCQIPGRYGFKWPTLDELHRKLFSEMFEGAHDALNDVMACSKCYFQLKKINVIK